MKRLIVLSIVVLGILVAGVSSAQVTEEWVARYNGLGNGSDSANAIAVDQLGNVYVTGEGDVSGTGGNYDYATVKYDANGNELWVARYNGPGNGNDFANAIALDLSGNVYVTGQSVGSTGGSYAWGYATVKYDTNGNQLWVARYEDGRAISIAVDSSGNVYVTGDNWRSGTYSDYVTIKYDTNGNELWVARYNGPGSGYFIGDYPAAMVIDSLGNVYVTGYSMGPGGPDTDYATVKYDTNGNELWVARYNGLGNRSDSANAIAVDQLGNVYVTGKTNSLYDYTTIKYDSLGNELWVAEYNGPGNDLDEATAIALAPSGDLYVTGWSRGNWGARYDDYATIKYDTNGNQLWVARYNGQRNGIDVATAMAVDQSGNIYVTGWSWRSASDDYVTIKYDTNGNELWVAGYNGPGNGMDRALAMAVDLSGNVYVTGYSMGSGTSFDYTTIKYSQAPPNQPPIADAGLDQDIYLGETAQLDGSNSSDPDGDPIVSYTWTIESAPAGSTATPSDSTIVNPTFTPDLEGQYLISLVVNDGVEDSAMDTVSINVTLNLPPVAAAIASPTTGDVPLSVSFNASGSSDPEAGALSFEWDFGDPLSGDNTSTLVNPTHTYNNVGTYTAIVTVTDDFNNTDQASVTIEVTAPNQPPTINPTANPSSGVAPLTVQLMANANDPEGDPLTYTWDFGDGTPLSTETNPVHTYTNPGTYIASVVVSDGEFDVSGEVTISVSSALTIDVTQAKVDFGKKGKVEGKVNLKADFVYTGIPDIYDLIVVTFDGVTLVEEPFGSFDEEDDELGEYKYKEKNIHVKIDFTKGTIKVSRHKMVLTGIDNSNGIDVVISFGDSTGTDHFVMKEKKKDDDDDDDEDEKKLSYKNKKKDDE